MTLEQMVQNREPDKTMQAGNWSSYCFVDDGHLIVNINHYWTMMLQFRVKSRKPYFPIAIRYVQHIDLGHGSKSDQDGMNRIFCQLGLPWYYARKNRTAQIIDLRKTPEHPALPTYMRDPTTRKEVYGYCA